MTLNPDLLKQATDLLRKSDRPLLISHPRPDGDTVGSALALRLGLMALGKQPLLACVHPIAANLAHLPGAEHYLTHVAEDADIDLVVAVDLSDLQRTGGIYKESWASRIPLLVIDHHETNDDFGDVNLVAPDAAATALPMLEVLRALEIQVRDEIATCLLAALITDTRGLRTESTTPEILELVGALIRAGGDYVGVMQKTLDAVPYQQMRSWGVALNRLQLDGELAWSTFPLAEKERLGIDDADDMDLGNLLARVGEAKIVAAFIEMRDGTVKVSLRSRPGYNVAGIAKQLGGGGHRQAAGYSLEGSLEVVVDRSLALVRGLLRDGDEPA